MSNFVNRFKIYYRIYDNGKYNFKRDEFMNRIDALMTDEEII